MKMDVNNLGAKLLFSSYKDCPNSNVSTETEAWIVFSHFSSASSFAFYIEIKKKHITNSVSFLKELFQL